MKKIALIALGGLFALSACKNSITSGFDKTPAGLMYKKTSNATGPKAKMGDILTVNFITRTQNDSVLVNTKKTGGPVQIEVRQPAFKGDVAEGLTMLSAGDSILFLVPVDSMFRKGAMPFPKYLKHGDYLKIGLQVIDVKSKEEVQKEMADAAAKQADQEKSTLDDYLKQNKIKAQQTASGLYYVIDKKGSGPLPKPGQSVTVNYTGSLLNGTVFDSSLKPGRQPFTFVLGQGQVIRGWDEGIALLPVGSKGRLIIPSGLGYGPQGNQGIPPNSPLTFEIEVISVK